MFNAVLETTRQHPWITVTVLVLILAFGPGIIRKLVRLISDR